MYRVVTPETPAELDAYYQLRWELLRKPFNLPLGSERDEYDTVAIHRLMLSPDGTPIAVGRLFVGGDEAQIRFMALRPEFRGQGLGARNRSTSANWPSTSSRCSLSTTPCPSP